LAAQGERRVGENATKKKKVLERAYRRIARRSEEGFEGETIRGVRKPPRGNPDVTQPARGKLEKPAGTRWDGKNMEEKGARTQTIRDPKKREGGREKERVPDDLCAEDV